MQIAIRSIRGADWNVRVAETDSILQLRQKISAELRKGLHEFYLVLDGEILSDTNTIEDYEMQEGSVIYLATKDTDQSTINAHLDDGRTLVVSFRFTDTVQKLRRVVGELAFGRRLPLAIVRDGRELEDSKTLSDCGVVPNCDIYFSRT